MFESLRKTPTVVGLDISSTAVKLLELSQDKGQYRVESYGVEVIPENAIVEKNIADIDAVGGAIKRVRQKSKTKPVQGGLIHDVCCRQSYEGDSHSSAKGCGAGGLLNAGWLRRGGSSSRRSRFYEGCGCAAGPIH